MESFELLEELGKGGFATTYRARVIDPELREEFGAEEVALKIPLNKQKERVLRRELELNAGIHMRLKGLHSVNLVRYLGFLSFQNQIVMVMEYVRQGSLRSLIGPIGRQRAMPIGEAIRIADQVLQGLTVIHNENVLHRDIKPENILMQDQTPKIADFGISRMLDAQQVALSVAGTVVYMPPEILSAKGGGFAADLWSLSVTTYEMLAGRLPFGDAHTPLRPLIDLICATPHQAIRMHRPEVPPAVEDVLNRGLHKDPHARFASATEMREALSRAMQPVTGSLVAEIDEIRELMRSIATTDLAVKRCRDLIARYGNDYRAHQCLGELHARRQHYMEAVDAFKKGVELAPTEALLLLEPDTRLPGRRQETRGAHEPRARPVPEPGPKPATARESAPARPRRRRRSLTCGSSSNAWTVTSAR